MKLLLLSNSKNPGGAYLQHALPWFEEILSGKRSILFIPFAGVSIDWDAYTEKFALALKPFGVKVIGLHRFKHEAESIKASEAIAVGGGNTFALLDHLYRKDLLGVLRRTVQSGVPYVGWSAGSNIAGPGIHTTNDMPIVYPPSFDALNLVEFQINPHYTEVVLPNFNGETRLQRIQEFLELNRDRTVLGLPEGSALQLSNGYLKMMNGPIAAIRYGMDRLWLEKWSHDLLE